MPRPTTKAELIAASSENYDKLMKFISGMTEEELSTPFDFSADEKKKEKHWQRDKNTGDVLAHLYEWHEMLIKWVNSNLKNSPITFLPAPYNWKNYGDLNMVFWEKHRSEELDDIKKMLGDSHKEVMEIMDSLSDDELFAKGKFKWTGGTTLGSYFISCTSSHYDWALKKLKAHRKNLKG